MCQRKNCAFAPENENFFQPAGEVAPCTIKLLQGSGGSRQWLTGHQGDFMKWAKRIVLVVVALIVVGLLIVYFSLNAIVRSEVQTQSTASLNVPTTLGSAHLALFGGSVGLNEL